MVVVSPGGKGLEYVALMVSDHAYHSKYMEPLNIRDNGIANLFLTMMICGCWRVSSWHQSLFAIYPPLGQHRWHSISIATRKHPGVHHSYLESHWGSLQRQIHAKQNHCRQYLHEERDISIKMGYISYSGVFR